MQQGMRLLRIGSNDFKLRPCLETTIDIFINNKKLQKYLEISVKIPKNI